MRVKETICWLICAVIVVTAGIAAETPSGEGTAATTPVAAAIGPESATNKAWSTIQCAYGKSISKELAEEIIAAVVWQRVQAELAQIPNTEQGKAQVAELRKVLAGTPEQKAETYCALMRAMHTQAYQAHEAQRAHEAAGKKLQGTK